MNFKKLILGWFMLLHIIRTLDLCAKYVCGLNQLVMLRCIYCTYVYMNIIFALYLYDKVARCGLSTVVLRAICMMTSSNGNIFRVAGHLCVGD